MINSVRPNCHFTGPSYRKHLKIRGRTRGCGQCNSNIHDPPASAARHASGIQSERGAVRNIRRARSRHHRKGLRGLEAWVIRRGRAGRLDQELNAFSRP
jgi:hypothetical protein